MQQLIEAEQSAGYITQEEYEELLDILDEIKESPEPKNERQKKKWKRWLGKVGEAGGKFVKGRAEKGVDTVVGEELKDWLGKGGLDTLMEFVNGLG